MGKCKYDESYIGKKYNHLTIKGYDYNIFGKRCFKCVCDCGEEKLVITTDVITGRVKSCGCMHREYAKVNATIHGACANGKVERLYNIYRGMIDRCCNANNPHYANYGGRGISVCREWKDDYAVFRKWAYENGYDNAKDRKYQSIDRIDNDKGYSPDNCRWTTMKIQRSNQRPHKEHKRRAMIILHGKARPKREVCAEYGISVEMFNYRVKHKGMSVIEALSTPKISIGRPHIAI